MVVQTIAHWLVCFEGLATPLGGPACGANLVSSLEAMHSRGLVFSKAWSQSSNVLVGEIEKEVDSQKLTPQPPIFTILPLHFKGPLIPGCQIC